MTQFVVRSPVSVEAPPLNIETVAVEAAPRGFYAAAVHQVFSGWGARLGAAWIVLLAIFALFSPLIANTYPYYIRTTAGGWSSPLWTSLTPLDLALAALGVVIIIGLLLRRSWRVIVLAGLAAVVVGGGVGAIKGSPQMLDYRKFRDDARNGLYAAVVNAPISSSPTDRHTDEYDLRDSAGNALPSVQRAAPGKRFLLGTDRDGADVASVLMHASRVALAIGFVATGLSVLLGIVIGGVMGFFAGGVDILGMRAIEIFEAVPRLMLLLALASIFGTNILLLMVIIGLTGWTGDARFIRAEFLRLRNQDFVQAATAVGLPLRSVLFRHMLPNGITPVLISSSFGVAGAILLESTLAFLGLGDPERPSWGQLLNQARGGGDFTWWIAVFPGLMIFLTVFAYTLIGEALRDALDPRLKKRD